MNTVADAGARFACPNCGSSDTASLEVTYMKGRWQTSGMMLGGGERIGMIVGGSEGGGTTALANKLAPPSKQSSMKSTILITFGLGLSLIGLACLLFALFGTFYHPIDRFEVTANIFWLLPGIVALYYGVTNFLRVNNYNERELPKLLKQWRKWWICHRCGKQFKPEE